MGNTTNKRYDGMSIFLVELFFIFVTILGTVVIAMLKANPTILDILLIVFGYLIIFYLLFVYSWWNVKIDKTHLKFYNNWKIFGPNNYRIGLIEIQSIEFSYYNWTGRILKTRPTIKVQFHQKDISIIGPSLSEVELLHKELEKTSLKIYSDYPLNG